MKRLILTVLVSAVSILLLVPAMPALPQGEEHDIQVVTGLDGASYETYKPSVVREVQQALKAKGLYTGEINGILNQETMKAIGEFQKQNGIMVNGVPTPETRLKLLGQQP